jgi:hypothetical protein
MPVTMITTDRITVQTDHLIIKSVLTSADRIITRITIITH